MNSLRCTAQLRKFLVMYLTQYGNVGLLRFQTHLSESVTQRVAREPEKARRLALVTIGPPQSLPNQILFILIERQAVGQKMRVAAVRPRPPSEAGGTETCRRPRPEKVALALSLGAVAAGVRNGRQGGARPRPSPRARPPPGRSRAAAAWGTTNLQGEWALTDWSKVAAFTGPAALWSTGAESPSWRRARST